MVITFLGMYCGDNMFFCECTMVILCYLLEITCLNHVLVHLHYNTMSVRCNIMVRPWGHLPW